MDHLGTTARVDVDVSWDTCGQVLCTTIRKPSDLRRWVGDYVEEKKSARHAELVADTHPDTPIGRVSARASDPLTPRYAEIHDGRVAR